VRIEGEISCQHAVARPCPTGSSSVIDVLSQLSRRNPAVPAYVASAGLAPEFRTIRGNAAAPVADICYRLDRHATHALESSRPACIPVNCRRNRSRPRLGDGARNYSQVSVIVTRSTRQQTLTATLEWCHNLLADDEAGCCFRAAWRSLPGRHSARRSRACARTCGARARLRLRGLSDTSPCCRRTPGNGQLPAKPAARGRCGQYGLERPARRGRAAGKSAAGNGAWYVEVR
jgi:hypothetical protein